MRKGIVAGEPGMFPWPFGRFYGLLGRWFRGRHHQPGDDRQTHDPETDAGGRPDYRAGRGDDQTRPPEAGRP